MMHYSFISTLCITYDAAFAQQGWLPHMTLADLGPLLKQARTHAKLSQQQLAQPLGMSRATISAIESGRCEGIGFSKLVALLELVGLEVIVSQRKGRPTIDDLRSERRGS
jgi:transcriptional regulator with XRE-family HTH domain